MMLYIIYGFPSVRLSKLHDHDSKKLKTTPTMRWNGHGNGHDYDLSLVRLDDSLIFPAIESNIKSKSSTSIIQQAEY